MMNQRELKKHSPTLTRLLKSRLAPVRETALLNAATSDEKPVKPAAGDCCGSSCNPCVMDLYREELKVWKECDEYRKQFSGDGEEELSTIAAKPVAGTTEDEKPIRRIPGAFEW